MSISQLSESFPKKRFAPHLLAIILFGLCQLAAEAIDLPKAFPDDEKRYGIGEDFDPTSPGNPQSDDGSPKGETHRLILVTDPVVAGEAYADSYSLSADDKVYVGTYGYPGFIFKNWTVEGKEVSVEAGFLYEMPDHDVTLVANYVFDPASPDNPTIEEQIPAHPVTLRAIPSVAAYFNGSDRFEMEENSTRQVYAYPNPGWHLTKWAINGDNQGETSSSLSVTMGDKALDIVAYFTFDPESPSNPGANYYNRTSGEVIIDDFTPGNLYRAMDQLVGYGNFENITTFIVKGKMTAEDMGCMYHLTNASTIDLSRTGGLTSIPSYAFYEKGFSSILLPSSVTNIEDGVFSGCKNLSSLTLYSPVPPICASYTFYEFDKGACTLYVPREALELYVADENWKDFMILPIMSDAHMLQVTLPEDAEDGRYKNYSLEIVNTRTGVRQKYVISDRRVYTFNGLQKDEQYCIYLYSQSGLEIGRIEDVVIPDEDIEVSFDSLKSLYSVTARVLTSDEEDVTRQVTVEWLRPLDDDNYAYLKKAISINEIPEGEMLICRVTLGDKLGMAYANPMDAEFTVSDTDNICSFILVPFRTIALSGSVADSDGTALADVSVSVNQILNGKYSKTYTAKTDRQGIWNMTVFDAPESRITYSANECVNVVDTIGAFETSIASFDVGKTIMKSIVGARVYYGFSYQAAGEDESETYYADYQNVLVSVYNLTQDRPHNEISLQYPILAVLDENIHSGDELRLVATSKTGEFNPIEKTVIVGAGQRAEVTFDIIGKGGIDASFEMTYNPSVMAMLYSDKGELIKKQTYSEAKTLFTRLDDGRYTLVSMGQSDLMNSILRLSNFAEIGLVEGKDYVKNTVEVVSGRLYSVEIEEVPPFDESLFYYTNSSTGFSANKSSVTTGNYLTLRAAIDFKGAYKEDISNVALVVDLPEACDFVEQSVIQGPNLLPYTIDGHRLTVQLGDNYQSQTRFCVIPTAGGTFNASASIVFDHEGTTIIQPIGTSTSEVKDIEISVPSVVASASFKVSGVALGNSEVNIYEEGTLLGSGKANAAGAWRVDCELTEPYNLSVHTIHAEITTPANNTLVSESKTVKYDVDAVQVSKVTMYHWNPELNTTFESEFDFLNPKTIPTQWTVYYPQKKFTYTIEFTDNDPERISNVVLYVHTADGKYVPVKASFDEKKGFWYAEIDMGNSSDGYYPVNCSIDFDYTAELHIDKKMIEEAYDTGIDLADQVAQNSAIYQDFLKELDGFTGTGQSLLDLVESYDSQIGFSYSSEVKEEDVLAEVEKILAMPLEEQKAYIESLESESQNNYKKIIDEDFLIGFEGMGSATVVIDEVEYVLSRSDASSFDEAAAEENGYSKISGEGFCFYTKLNENPMSYEIVDPSRNMAIMLVATSEEALLAKAKASGLDAAELMFEAAIESLQKANEMLEKVASIVIDFVDWACEIADVIISGIDKDIRIAEVAAKYAYEEGVVNGDMSTYHYWVKRASSLKTNKANTFKWLDNAKSFKNSALVKKYSLLLNVKSLITDVLDWWNLYKKIRRKIPCEAEPDRALQLLGDVEYYGGLVCAFDVLNLTSSCMALYSAVVAVAATPETGGASLVLAGAGALTLQGFGFVAGIVGGYMSERMYDQLRDEISKLNCRTDCGQPGQPSCPDDEGDEKGPGGNESGNPNDNVKIDPSGYVYEAVPANRVQGVEATIYYKETKEDMYGEPYDEVILWDAEEYSQKNPLFTDENGMYQWDVPQGLWQVKFEKDGYSTAFSEWLPVPPPQLEVNIGIVQNKQPEVIEARAYEDGVEVQFDKFMTPSTLTSDNIYVTANGERLHGEILLIDSALADEYAREDDPFALRYASRIRFVPEESLSVTTGEIRLTVSRNVLSYAGIPMTEAFSQVLDVEKEVKVIYADDVKVLYGGEKELTIYAVPSEAAVGRTLRIGNSSGLIASVSADEAVIDEEGKAVITVQGDLPGRTQLSFSIDGVTETGDCMVDVVTEIITAEAPKASRASGTAVYRGSKIELTTTSKDATIYFTTDGSCPCDENGTRRKYTVPIVIDEDTKILAMTAVGDGDDDVSEVVEFNYTLKRTDIDFQFEEGWTWISHTLDGGLAPSELASDASINLVVGQTQEAARDPQKGLVGDLAELVASESYKVHTSAATSRKRLSDVAWNPATPISVKAGCNWIGYPVGQVMTVDEAFEPTKAETLDVIVGQEGFSQFDGKKWIGTLETLSPGMGYMYFSQKDNRIVYNTSIISSAASNSASRIAAKSPLVVDIHKYGMIMPMVASICDSNGGALDNEDYNVAAFCGSECRGVGKVVDGLVMMSVYGNSEDEITLLVTASDGEDEYDSYSTLKFSEKVVGSLHDPYIISVNDFNGVSEVSYNGNINVYFEGDMLRIKGIASDNISNVDVYDIQGQKLLHAAQVSDSGIRTSMLSEGVYVVIVSSNGHYTYHKVAKK